MDDMISRQAAIEAVLHHGEIENNYTDLYYDGYCDGVYDSADMLKGLPTAEPRVISPDKFRDKMIEIRERNDSDPEMTHIYMDKFMCETLKLLGYGEGVEVFEKQDKWYS